MTATADVLEYAVAPHRLPDAVRLDAERLLADTLAVGAAGAASPSAAGVRAAVATWGEGGAAHLIGSPQRRPAASAAFANGFFIHGLEWDAVHEPAVVHALSVVVAALGAVIDRQGGCDPEAALTALAVGVDIAAGLGIAADTALSFFRPATAGCLGAAAAVARIAAPERIADVLGLAYSACAGTMQAHVEGSVALPLQIAGAARAAVSALDLATAGLSGPHDMLEGPFGYFQLLDRGELARYTVDLGRCWRIAEVSTKPFPCGRASHGVLGALAAMHGEIGGRSVTAIEARVPPLVARLVGRPWRADMSPAYARLCLPLLAALMLEDGCIDPRRFEAGRLPAAAPLVLVDDGNGDPNALSPQQVTVTLADGARLERVVADTLGSPRSPLSPAEASAKMDLARALAPPVTDPRLFDAPLAYFTERR